MTTEDYESRTDSVLAWKKAQKLGRFDPNAPEIEQAKIDASFQEVESRGPSEAIFNSKTDKGFQKNLTLTAPPHHRHQNRPPLPHLTLDRPPPRRGVFRR